MDSDEMAGLGVILVDDDRAMLRTTRDLLALRGIEAVMATSGREALELAGREPPAVALVDVVLPDMDGLELAAHLREAPLRTEVVILTGNATVESAVRALRAQSVDYLIKPVQEADLFRSVERAAARFFRRRAEALLEESEDQLRRIFSAVSDGLVITDAEGSIVRVNAAARRIFGRADDELMGLDVETILRPAEGDVPRDVDGAELREWEILRPDGGLRRVEVAVAGFAPGRLVHTVRDVTVQREVQEQLRQAHKLESIGRLAGGVAHDFNNLLTSINGNCEVALLDLPPGDPTRSCLEEIRSSGQRAANLTRQLLAFSRKQVLQPRLLRLADVVRGMESLLRPIIGEDVELCCVYEEDAGLVRADPTQMEQVVLNLAANARDAMPLGGTLTIAVEDVTLVELLRTDYGSVPAGAYVRLSVSDTGAGIPPEVRPSIFEPFFTTKPTGKGTGLGLATVYGVVHQSGGEIGLESVTGEGTTIRVYLPRVEGETPASAPVDVLPERLPASGETILVAEDEEAVRILIARTLSRLGYWVLTAADGAEALGLLDRHEGRVDLLVADVVMPDIGGAELVERLRREREGIPVIFITGYGEDVLVRRDALAGARLLEKPFSLPTLAALVREALEERRDETAPARGTRR